MILKINSVKQREVIDITDQVSRQVNGSGLLHVFALHTTVALAIAELDSGTDVDLLNSFEHMTPTQTWNHSHDPIHFPDHLWSTLVGTNLMIPLKEGKLLLGRWQRLVLIEFNGPKERELALSVLKTS